jgi:hypothetical protein
MMMKRPGSAERRFRLNSENVALGFLVATIVASSVLSSLVVVRSRSPEAQVRRCAKNFGASPSLVEQVRRDTSVGLSWADGRGWYAVDVGRENSGTVGDVWDWSELAAVRCEAPFD